MSDKPDFSAQFRDPPGPRFDRVYMGGTAMSCGQHPSLPSEHRWGRWKRWTVRASGNVYWDRTCKMCALVSDPHWGDRQP